MDLHPRDLIICSTLEIAALVTVLMGLLGLGGLRTIEKWSGRAK